MERIMTKTGIHGSQIVVQGVVQKYLEANGEDQWLTKVPFRQWHWDLQLRVMLQGFQHHYMWEGNSCLMEQRPQSSRGCDWTLAEKVFLQAGVTRDSRVPWEVCRPFGSCLEAVGYLQVTWVPVIGEGRYVFLQFSNHSTNFDPGLKMAA